MNWKKISYVLVFIATLVFCTFPLLNLIKFGFAAMRSLELTHSISNSIVNTLLLAFFTTLFSTTLGTFFAYLLSRSDLLFKSKVKTLLLYPYIIPSYLLAIGWIILANPTVGILNMLAPIFNIYGLGGIIFVETLFLYTFVLLNVSNALTNMDGSLEEAARLCGAHPVKIFFVITLPLLKSTLVGSALVVFLTSLSSFGVPAMIGGPAKVFVLTTQIYQFIKVGTPESLGRAAGLSIPIIVIAFLLLYTAEKILSHSAYKTLSGKHTRKLEVKLRHFRVPATLLTFLFAGISVILPLTTIFIFSLMPSYGNWNLSFKNYMNVIFDPAGLTLRSFADSLLLALASALIISIFAFAVSYFASKTRYKFKNTLSSLASLPYATPGTILGMALLFQFTTASPVLVILLAYCIKYLSFGIKVMTPALNAIDSSLEEAALTCGAGWFRTIGKIWLPIMRGSFTTTGFLVFAPLFSELTMSILLVGPTTPTLGARLFQLQEYESPNHASVLAMIILVVVLAVNMLVKKISKGKLGI